MSDRDPAPDAGDGTPAGDVPADAPTAKRPKRRRWVKVLVGTVVLLLLAVGIGTIYAYNRFNHNLTKQDWTSSLSDRPTAPEVEGPDGPVNILVMGSDSREGKNNIDGLTGLGNRSDTTILLHLSADRSRAYGISIPRDSMVERPDCVDEHGEDVPGYSSAMWNEAFNKAGPGCTIHQLEQTTGVRVDHAVVVDFNGFRDMVDAIGGVEICVPEEISDPAHNIYLPAGTYEAEGKQALDYVRERYGVGDGSDIGRIKRQQAFVASMANKVVSAGTLANPVKLFNFLDAATKSLEVDTGMGSLKDIAGLGYQFRDIGLDNIQFVTVPWEVYPEDPNRVQWRPEADQIWEHIAQDKALPKELTDGAITAESPSESQSGDDATTGGVETAPEVPTSTPTGPETSTERSKVGLCG